MPSLLTVTKGHVEKGRLDKLNLREITHLYRSILRATTYLPDSFARTYTRELVTKRFRQNSGKKSSVVVIQNQLKKARHARRVLERAGDGNVDDLKDVLMRVYGRKGPRKRVLLEDLLRKAEDEILKNNEALQELITNPTGRQATEYQLGSKFFQFLRSQQANQPLDYQSSIKKLQPKIPETNIWLRPVPLKAQEGIRQRWLATTLEKIAPPVPLAEWQRLEGFATGKIPLEEAPDRRPAALSAEPEPEWSHDVEKVLDFLNHCAKQDRRSEEGGWLEKRSEGFDLVGHGIQKGRLDTELVKFDEDKGLCVHEKAKEDPVDQTNGPMSKRAIRRLYALIWNMTPTMQQDEISKQWKIKWGGQRSAAHNGEVSKPSEVQKEFFEGLEGVHTTPSRTGRGTGNRNRNKKIATQNKKLGVPNPLLS